MLVRLDTAGMVVRDMGKALAFYRLLGLDVPAEQDVDMHVDVHAGRGQVVNLFAPLPSGTESSAAVDA